MYIQAAFNHNKPSPATLGSQHNLEEKIVQSLSLPCPAWAGLTHPAALSCSPWALPQPRQPGRDVGAEVELQVVDEVRQGSALPRGHMVLAHIHFGQAFSCCASAHRLGWSSSSWSLLEKPSLQHRATICAFTSTTFPECCRGKGTKTLVHFMQCEKSTEIHLSMKVECVLNTWNLQKSPQVVLELWLYCTGAVLSCLTRQTRSMFLRQTVQSFEHNIWHVVCDHLGTY